MPDNNAAERALRAVALGRKNYLFAGSDNGGERAAAIYSLIGSAKVNGLDPEAYLRELLSRIADHPSTALATCSPGTSGCKYPLKLFSIPVNVSTPDAYVQVMAVSVAHQFILCQHRL